MKPFLAIVFLVAFPFLTYWNVNKIEAAFVPHIFFREAAVIYFSVLIIICLIAALMSLLPGIRFAKILVTLALLFLLLFMFGSLHGPLTTVLGKYESEWIMGYSVLLLSAIALIFYLLKYESFQSLIGIFSIVIVAVPLFQLIVFYLFTEEQTLEIASDPKGTVKRYSPAELKALDRPNVYYVVVDAYGGAESVKRFVGLDISKFIDTVKARNMYVAEDAQSPYNMTFLSMAAIMQANYVIDEKSKRYTNRKPFYPGIMRRGPKPVVVDHFEQLGYTFNVFSNKWGKCSKKHAKCPSIPNRGVLSYEIHGLLSGTPFSWYENRFGIKFLEPSPGTAVDAIGNATSYLKRNGVATSPSVYLIHHLPPHPPYVFEADCTERESIKFDFSAWHQKSKPLFAANLECTNKRILSFLDWIDANDPKAIVIITGDHGSAFKGASLVAERMSTLTMARLPPRCQKNLRQDINFVNLMRIAMSCVENTEPVLVKQRSYIGSYRKKGKKAGKVRLVQPENNK